MKFDDRSGFRIWIKSGKRDFSMHTWSLRQFCREQMCPSELQTFVVLRVFEVPKQSSFQIIGWLLIG
jgi:hypothetical protein